MSKTNFEKKIYETIIEEFENERNEKKIKRPDIMKEIDVFNSPCSDDSEIIGITQSALESYGKRNRECPVSKFFILAILTDMDLNKLKRKIQDTYKIKPIEKQVL